MTTNKMVLGIMVGVALGVVAGILAAPAKGVETRRRMKDAGSGFCDTFKNKYNHLIDDITSTLDSVANHEDTDSPTHEVNHTSAVL